MGFAGVVGRTRVESSTDLLVFFDGEAASAPLMEAARVKRTTAGAMNPWENTLSSFFGKEGRQAEEKEARGEDGRMGKKKREGSFPRT